MFELSSDQSIGPEMIIFILGVCLSMIAEYFPGLNRQYNALPNNQQRLLMLAAVGVIVFGGYGLACAGWIGWFTCDSPGLKDAVFLYFLTLASNQGLHRALPRKQSPVTHHIPDGVTFKGPAKVQGKIVLGNNSKLEDVTIQSSGNEE